MGVFARSIFGLASAGLAGAAVYHRMRPHRYLSDPVTDPTRPRIVVLGTGWASVSFLKALYAELRGSGKLPHVTVVSPRNYFLFTPLLPGAATGTCEPDSLAASVREMAFSRSFRLVEGECVAIDPRPGSDEAGRAGRHAGTITVRSRGTDAAGGGAIPAIGAAGVEDKEGVAVPPPPALTSTLPYDVLVVGIGGINQTFGTPGVEDHALFLKTAADARTLRRRLVGAFEAASAAGLTAGNRAEIARSLSFVVCGGGPTGVEVTGELRDFIEGDAARLYGSELASLASLTMIQSREHILNTFSEMISEVAEESLRGARVQVLTNHRVRSVGPHSVTCMDKATKRQVELPAGLVVWSTGLGRHPLADDLAAALPAGTQRHRAGVTVHGDLSACGAPVPGSIYVLGDAAALTDARALDNLTDLFARADIDGNGELSAAELQALFAAARREYPQLSHMANKAQTLLARYDADGNGSLSAKEFAVLLREADEASTPLPRTAQCAEQMGRFVAANLAARIRAGPAPPRMRLPPPPENEPQFEYEHAGSFSTIGGEKAVLELRVPGTDRTVSMAGFFAMLLWRGAHLSELVDLRTRLALLGDWTRVWWFGRSIANDADSHPTGSEAGKQR
jgi:NADH:ubiquinone reductase (non-electrogenic)